MDAEDAARARARQQAEKEGDFDTIFRQVSHKPHAAAVIESAVIKSEIDIFDSALGELLDQ